MENQRGNSRFMRVYMKRIGILFLIFVALFSFDAMRDRARTRTANYNRNLQMRRRENSPSDSGDLYENSHEKYSN